ncbi:MAG: biotin--[acetyl-CoA-carboxylase] ligase [Anaerolineae bacterium]|nr:MAG: biotin--[acetyl-CoA-carboxylase] ligase [Anaerolineae bacterium]
MNLDALHAALGNLPLGALRYFPRTGSTNDVALRWGAAGAPDMATVIANEQTAGRGRAGRQWHTPAGTALAVSVLLRAEAFPVLPQGDAVLRLTGLGALSICLALHSACGLEAQVKWPNDVLLQGKKVAGVLTELSWTGETWQYAVIGMGVNVHAGSLPPAERLRFPATSIEHITKCRVQRTKVLYEILHHLVTWRARIHTPKFLHLWEAHLAWRGSEVTLSQADGRPIVHGRLLGLDENGALRLQTAEGIRSMRLGEMHLRQETLS